MDCSAEFTKSSRTVSIVIAVICDTPGDMPQTADDAFEPLPACRRAVNPIVPCRSPRTNLPVAAAVLHAPTTSLESFGTARDKHATCRG